MAIYDFKCDDCDQEYEIHMPVALYDSVVASMKSCDKCKGKVARWHKTAPNLSIPANMRAVTSAKYYGIKDFASGEFIPDKKIDRDSEEKISKAIVREYTEND